MEKIKTDYLELYIYQAPKAGNIESGDAYFVHTAEDYCLFAIADGLGHGPIARQSAEIIPTVLQEFHHESLDEMLSRCNEYMVQKRGAAVALVKVDYKHKTIEYSCVGNVRFYMLTGGEKMIYPLPVMGYLSGRPQRLRTQKYTYKQGDVFFLHSDGVVLQSPKSMLKESLGAHEVYRNVAYNVENNDDATFITGNLLQ